MYDTCAMEYIRLTRCTDIFVFNFQLMLKSKSKCLAYFISSNDEIDSSKYFFWFEKHNSKMSNVSIVKTSFEL